MLAVVVLVVLLVLVTLTCGCNSPTAASAAKSAAMCGSCCSGEVTALRTCTNRAFASAHRSRAEKMSAAAIRRRHEQQHRVQHRVHIQFLVWIWGVTWGLGVGDVKC